MPSTNQAIRLPKPNSTCLLTVARIEHFDPFFPDRNLNFPKTTPILARASNWPLQRRIRRLLVIVAGDGRSRLEARTSSGQ